MTAPDAASADERVDLRKFAWLSIAAAILTIALKTGAWAMTDLSTCASMSSGRVLRNMPRGALPTGVRVAATM